MNRPEGSDFNNPNGINCKNGPIIYKHAAVFSICEEANEVKPIISLGGLQTVCCYCEALKQFVGKQSDYEFSIQGDIKPPFIESILNSGNKIMSIVNFL